MLMISTSFGEMFPAIHSSLYSFTAEFNNQILAIYDTPATTRGPGNKQE